MDLGELKAFLIPSIERVQALMASALASDIGLLEATNRSILDHAGKMIRPVMSLLVAGACGEVGEDTIRFAAAAELLHNATLLHDDVVDGAQERRGQPTVSSILSGPASVLIGDYWLVKAMQCILDASRGSSEVIHVFAKTLSDLAEGEMLQLEKASRCDTTEADYIRIIYSKTASLFESSARAAALSVGADGPAVESVASYARHLGLAFQIKDDIFDYVSGSEVGKPVGIDLLEQKITMPLLCALEAAPSEARTVRDAVRRIGEEPALADTVRDFVRAHDGVALAGTRLDGYVEKAVVSLSPLPDSAEKSYLAQLARYVGERTC
ncbi:MAG: polyprenyl synthetase family protein [Bacteroidales bacterium]|nr:polyprenyl synthetase family protein [Bacteroidales bacterium]